MSVVLEYRWKFSELRVQGRVLGIPPCVPLTWLKACRGGTRCFLNTIMVISALEIPLRFDLTDICKLSFVFTGRVRET